MINKLLIASNNEHKISEVKSLLENAGNLKVCSLKDENIFISVNETGKTLKENAYIKAIEIHKVAGLPVIADDTGLFVSALEGEPGVYSARYAGENASYKDNCEKLIDELKKINVSESTAEFITVICYIDKKGNTKYFEGVVRGVIKTEMKGKNGFGYDPLFIPEGSGKTFAELSEEEKNQYSHRSIAVKKFAEYFKQLLK